MTDERKPLARRAVDLRNASAAAVVVAGSNLLAAAIGAFSEDTATGLARVHRILHDAEAGPFFRRLGREFGELVEKGKVKAERITDHEVRTTLASIAEDLEKEVPDQRRLDLLSRAFLAIAIGDERDPRSTQGLAFMQTVRRLSGLQAQVLAVGYRNRDVAKSDGARAQQWMETVANECGLPFRSYFYSVLRELTTAHLVHTHASGAAMVATPETGVFTDYGFAFCEFLQRAEPFPEPPAKVASPAT